MEIDQMTKFRTTLDHDKEVWYLKLGGDSWSELLTIKHPAQLLGVVEAHGVKILYIDLTYSQSIDSRGLRFLIEVQKPLSKKDIEIIVHGIGPHLSRLFRIMHLDELFTVDRT